MEDARRMELVGELETIAKTGGKDTTQAIKTIAGALAEALGPSPHERAVREEMEKVRGLQRQDLEKLEERASARDQEQPAPGSEGEKHTEPADREPANESAPTT